MFILSLVAIQILPTYLFKHFTAYEQRVRYVDTRHARHDFSLINM